MLGTVGSLSLCAAAGDTTAGDTSAGDTSAGDVDITAQAVSRLSFTSPHSAAVPEPY